MRVAETLIPLMDGRAAMLALCLACLTAREHIWLIDWDLHAELELVRGRDQCAGEPGTPEQVALLERLRAEGLDEEALTFWQAGKLRVVDVLSFAARRGVDVQVLLWAPFPSRAVRKALKEGRSSWSGAEAQPPAEGLRRKEGRARRGGPPKTHLDAPSAAEAISPPNIPSAVCCACLVPAFWQAWQAMMLP